MKAMTLAEFKPNMDQFYPEPWDQRIAEALAQREALLEASEDVTGRVMTTESLSELSWRLLYKLRDITSRCRERLHDPA